MLTFKHSGNFNNIERFLKRAGEINFLPILEKYGQEGVNALALATPVDTGFTSQCWTFKVRQNGSSLAVTWMNTNVVNKVPIAIILQYGHATRNGGYVQGRDYINPALRPIFDKIAARLWEEVSKK